MKGLLIKDLCLLRNQKKLLPIFLILAVWFTAFNGSSFAFPFLAMMASIVTLSTLSYDEADKSQAHLFTLPFDRRTYVTEKYLLGMILLASSQALACVCSLVRALAVPDAAENEIGFSLLFSVCAGVIMLSLMLPVRIRFGNDQGRIILYAGFAVIALGCAAVSRMLPIDAEKINLLPGTSMRTIAIAAISAAAVIGCAGYFIAVRWIRNKEF